MAKKMTPVKVAHCKPMKAGGLTVSRPTAPMAPIKPLKGGGVVVRGRGAATKGTKFTGPNG